MAATPRQKISEGREAEIFEWGHGVVLRLLRNPNALQQIEWEAAAMRAAAGAGVRVPQVIEVVTVDGRPGLVMERIEGIDMLTLVGKQPWQVFAMSATAGRIQAELNCVAAPPCDCPASVTRTVWPKSTRNAGVSETVTDTAPAPLLSRTMPLSGGSVTANCS